MSKRDYLLSIVVPAYNEEGNIAKLISELNKVLLKTRFEVIFVDDGSKDDTLRRLVDLSKVDKRVRYISFSKNFGHQAALRAGLMAAKGAAVVSMDADLQHPPSLLPQLISKWQEGYDVIYTVRKDDSSTGLLKRLTSKFFYKLVNYLSDLDIDEGAADFRLLDRRVVDVINSQTESSIFLRGYINWIGFKQIGVDYEPAKRFSGETQYTLKKMLSLAGNGVTQFSVKPLRLAFALAAIALSVSLLYVFYAIAVAVSGGSISGWVSVVVLFISLQGVQFLLLGLVGEYLGRTFMDIKHRPDYIIAKTSDDN